MIQTDPNINNEIVNNEYYLKDPNLPTPQAQFKYTPHMVKEIKKCSRDVLYFAENYFYIVTLEKGKQLLKLYRPQKRILKSFVMNRFVVVLSSRQIGKTTMLTAYALWLACFASDKRILIVANKEDTAVGILRKIRMAYEQLPSWLKPGVKQWGKTEIIFANDSSIGIATTTASTARGEAANCLVVDEMAFIPENLIKDFWNSVIPVISSHRSTKIFCVSTPNGAGNLFHRIYTGAERGELPQWHYERVDWWEIPGRGKLWKEEMMDALAGEGKSFDQEFGCVFLETGQSAVDGELIQEFRENARPPKMLLDDEHYKIWEPPQHGRVYSIGVDIGEGVGQAASVAQVLDITDLTNITQAASYHNNMIDPFHFATVLYKMANQWGRPQLLIERNNCGGQVIDALTEVHHYPNIIDYTPEKQKGYSRLGIYCHTNAKFRGVMNMRYWMNSLRTVKIYDIATIQELETFVKYPNGTWKKKAGDYIFDDRVMSLIWALFALEPDICEKYFEILQYDEQGKPAQIQPINIEGPEYFSLNDSNLYFDDDAPLPVFINPGNFFNNRPNSNSKLEDGDDVQDLLNNGWTFQQ